MSDVHYFAYGSNMNPERVTARGVEYIEILSGHLFGYELVFNKYSKKREGSAANIKGARMKSLRASCISWPTQNRSPKWILLKGSLITIHGRN